MNVEHEWWATSYHEAGHAALRVHYGLPLVAVTISTNGGMTEGGDPIELDEVDDHRILGEVVSSFAGPLSEAWYLHHARRLTYRRAHRQAFGTSTGDLANIQQIADELQWSEQTLRGFEGDASGLVAELWDSIDAIAEGLRDNNGYLTGDQIYRIA